MIVQYGRILRGQAVSRRGPLREKCFTLGHIGVNVRDLVQAKAYYDSLMPLLGFEPYIAAADRGKELIRSIEANWKVFLIRLVRMTEMLIFQRDSAYI